MLAAQRTMAEAQGATLPAWRARSRLALLADVLDGWRRPRLAWKRLRQLIGFVLALVRPGLVRSRLERLRRLGHVDAVPTTAQVLVAARDQMMMGASEETKLFYRSQGIPWIFHNLRRLVSGPATMLDPAGLFAPRDTLIEHVLQTFHRHPVYDLVLLRGFSDGLDQMEAQARQVVAGNHPEQRALASLIEDGSYHQRLVDEVRAFRADPFMPARPIPPGLVADSLLMLAMDQFKDLRGFTSYAARLRVGLAAALGAWLEVAWNETLGGVLKLRIGPSAVEVGACDPAIVARHLAPDVR
jgi:hypothetical protein